MKLKIKENEGSVRFTVYDSFGGFLGFKRDSFWSLVEKERYAKAHPAEDARISSHLLNNLLYLLNQHHYYELNLLQKRAF